MDFYNSYYFNVSLCVLDSLFFWEISIKNRLGEK
jgi:hypothetical protein